MEARRTAASAQVAAVAALRVALAFFWTAILIWIILGGLDAYTGGYDWLTERLDWLPQGDSGALVLTAVGIVVWGLFASVVQVLVYRRGLRRWPEGSAGEPVTRPAPGPRAPRRRLDPRAVATAACVAWAVLLLSADWPLLLAVIAWLAVAWLVAQPDRDFVPVGAVLAGVLALSALIAGLLAALPLETTLERAGRAGLLVAVATWFRAAAGTPGIREVSQRVLGRLARVLPGAREAGPILGDLGSADVLLPAGRALADELKRRAPAPAPDARRSVAVGGRRVRALPSGAPDPAACAGHSGTRRGARRARRGARRIARHRRGEPRSDVGVRAPVPLAGAQPRPQPHAGEDEGERRGRRDGEQSERGRSHDRRRERHERDAGAADRKARLRPPAGGPDALPARVGVGSGPVRAREAGEQP